MARHGQGFRRGFVSCLIVEMRDLFRRRQGEMAAEEAGWEGGGLSEVSGVCAGVAGDAGSPDLHSTLPEASLYSSTSPQPSSSHLISPPSASSQSSPPEL